MAYPAGITLSTITVGSVIDFFGESTDISVTVRPVLGGDGKAKHIVHADSGHVMLVRTMVFQGSPGGPISFQVPHVDQTGFVTSSGEAITMWAYEATVVYGKGKEERWVKNFQPLIGQDLLDLDLIPDGNITAPVTAPAAAVTSVNGITGAVTLLEATPETIEAGLPPRLSEAELSSTIAGELAPVESSVVASRRINTNRLVQSMVTAPVMATPPTFTYSATAFAGYVAGATNAVAGWPNNTAIRPSGAPLAPPNEFSATYPLGPDSQLTIFDGAVHFDFDCPDQTFVFRTQLTAEGRFRIWVDGQPHAATPVMLTTLGAASGSPGYIKVDFGSRSTNRKISIELMGTKPNTTGTPLPFYGVWKESTGSVWPTSISSPRMVVLGDSYGKGIGAAIASDAYPVQLGRLLGITDTHHFTCVSSTGIMKGTTTNSYRTRLQKIIDAKPDIVLFQGSINDADAWPTFQGQIGPQFKLDIATLRAGLPNALIIVTSPLEVRVATAAELAVRDELKTAVIEMGLPFIDILGTQFFNGTGKVGATKGDGNGDYFVAPVADDSSGAHPSSAGHLAIAKLLAGKIAPLIGATSA